MSRNSKSPRSESGVDSPGPVWSDTSSPARSNVSVHGSPSHGIVQISSPVYGYGQPTAPAPAAPPAFTYYSSESPGGTFRQRFTCSGELRAPVYISYGNITVQQDQQTASGTTSNSNPPKKY